MEREKKWDVDVFFSSWQWQFAQFHPHLWCVQWAAEQEEELGEMADKRRLVRSFISRLSIESTRVVGSGRSAQPCLGMTFSAKRIWHLNGGGRWAVCVVSFRKRTVCCTAPVSWLLYRSSSQTAVGLTDSLQLRCGWWSAAWRGRGLKLGVA